MRRAAARMRSRIRHLVDSLHFALSKWLCENYRVILIPKFEVKNMIRKGKRKLRSKTVRQMVTLSHYKFRTRLINKAREYKHCNVIVVTEEYTSKTCGNCGNIHKKLGGKKQFKCPDCNTTMDRDCNGARNICLKYISSLI